MAIKFICSCGKHLRARDEMAARRSVCPRCGQPVGIPSLQPTHPGAPAGPMTPAERQRTRRVVPPAELARPQPAPVNTTAPPSRPTGPVTPEELKQSLFPEPLNSQLVQDVLVPRPRGRWSLETRWYHCLLYPLRACPLVLGLAAALTVLTAGTSLVLPELRQIAAAGPAGLLLTLCAPFVLFPFLLAGYTWAFLDCTFDAGAAGEMRYVHWPGRDLGLVVHSGITWLVSFLAGPLLLAAVALAYWVHCGRPALVDWFILTELGVLTVGYWLLAVLAVRQKDRLLDANPARVAELVERLGWRVVLAVGMGAAWGAVAAVVVFLAVAELHRHLLEGMLLLLAGWGGGLFGATFLFRLLGVWCRTDTGR
jgi:hypothetical protein